MSFSGKTDRSHASINFLGGNLDRPIWYRTIRDQMSPRISFRFPLTISTFPVFKLEQGSTLNGHSHHYIPFSNFVKFISHPISFHLLCHHVKIQPHYCTHMLRLMKITQTLILVNRPRLRQTFLYSTFYKYVCDDKRDTITLLK